MVESAESEEVAPDQFIKLNESAALKIYLELAFQKGFIKIWNKGDKAFDCLVESVNKGDSAKGRIFLSKEEDSPITLTLSLKNIRVSEKLKMQTVFVYFSLNKSKFFSKGYVAELTEGESLDMQVDKDLYKLDQRKSKRLITFPNYRVFAYIKLDQGKNESVLSFTKPKDHLNDFFTNFQKQVLENQFNPSNSLEKDFMAGHIGFRVMDLSNTGLSFLLNQIEADYFRKLKSDFKMMFNFNGKKDDLEMCKVSYLVPYVDPKLGGLSLFKLGLEFKEIDGLIERPLQADEEGDQVIKHFADFVK
jgi:hypothetical protein